MAALQGELQAGHNQRRQLEAAVAQRQREWQAAMDEERQMVAALQTQVGCVGRCLPAAAWHRQDAVWATFARQAASQLKCVAAGLACLCTQVEGYERSRMALAKSFFENKMRSDAAKVGGLLWSGWRSFPAVFQIHRCMPGSGDPQKSRCMESRHTVPDLWCDASPFRR